MKVRFRSNKQFCGAVVTGKILSRLYDSGPSIQVARNLLAWIKYESVVTVLSCNLEVFQVSSFKSHWWTLCFFTNLQNQYYIFNQYHTHYQPCKAELNLKIPVNLTLKLRLKLCSFSFRFQIQSDTYYQVHISITYETTLPKSNYFSNFFHQL